MDDSRIIALYFDRDETAVAATVEKYDRYCRTVAQNILGSYEDAEECVNDTWLRAWNSIPPAHPDNLRAYLAKITRRLALDRLEKNTADKRGGYESPAPLEELSDILSAPDTPDDDLNASDLASDIDRFLRTQPTRTADIFVLRYFHGESIDTLAARCDLRPNAVSALLSRTRKKLKKYLMGKGYSV